LPDRYRAVVVLCYWEGLTQEQAAAQLGCPLGTVRSRLARARALLRRRLTRRGLAPLGGVLPAGWGCPPAPAPLFGRLLVPSKLVDLTVRAAAKLSNGQTTSQVVSCVAARLVERFLWRMSMIKMSTALAGVVVLGLAGYGAGWATQIARRSGKDHEV